ncbi:MAG TPA: transposase, partial [Mycobacterium sp.]|nr:transposase [Mycobacterium sp.]
VPDSPATVALRRVCRARKDLIGHRVRLANQLREHLKRVFPGAIGLFTDLASRQSEGCTGAGSAVTPNDHAATLYPTVSPGAWLAGRSG